MRCRWCGRFLPADTKLTTRCLDTGGWPRRNVSQLLCPQHAKDWSVDTDWNQPPDPSLPIEVLGAGQS